MQILCCILDQSYRKITKHLPFAFHRACISTHPLTTSFSTINAMMHLAFLPALALHHNAIKPLSIRPLNNRRSQKLKNPHLVTKCAWEDTIFNEPIRQEPSPTSSISLHLLSLSSTAPLAYATTSTLGTPRKTYATNSSALPLPYTLPEKSVITHALSHLRGLKQPPFTTPPSIPFSLLQQLGISRAECVPVFSGNCALGVLHVICTSGAMLQRVIVEELPSTEFELCAMLLLRVPNGSVCGEVVYKSVYVQVSAGFGVALGNVAGVEVAVERELYDMASVSVMNMVNVYEARGGIPVVEKFTDHDGFEEPEFEVGNVVPWELTASEVDVLSDTSIRQSLRRYGVGVTQRESRESLLRKFVGLMDEVQRRELGVLLAAREGMYALAAELQAGRSKRGTLLKELQEAEKNGNWSEVVKLGIRIRRLESGIMDITAEPGSYSRDLDRDEWYQPNR